MSESTELSNVPRELATQQPPSIGQMLQSAISAGVTSENVAVLEKMMDLYERTQAKEAEKEFARAFNALQADTPSIQAVKAVPNNDGTVRYKFAPYEEIMQKVRPLLQKHGFTVTFSMTAADGRITQSCTLQHTSGHSKTNQFTVRVGQGPPKSSEAQGDGAAATYAKRQALCDCLNVVVEHDSDGANPPQDARNLGAPISPEQVIYLREQVRETGSNEAAFLKYAQATSYETIGTAQYSMLVRQLESKKTKKV